MLMPSIFGNDMFGDFFTDPWFDDKEFKDMQKKLYGHRAKNVMSTDVKEVDPSSPPWRPCRHRWPGPQCARLQCQSRPSPLRP